MLKALKMTKAPKAPKALTCSAVAMSGGMLPHWPHERHGHLQRLGHLVARGRRFHTYLVDVAVAETPVFLVF
jgi:hypothetical protein